MANKMHPLNVRTVAMATGLFGLFAMATGVVWHGILGQPSIMNLVYPGFWSSQLNWLIALVIGFVAGKIYGAAFAWIFNWTLKKIG